MEIILPDLLPRTSSMPSNSGSIWISCGFWKKCRSGLRDQARMSGLLQCSRLQLMHSLLKLRGDDLSDLPVPPAILAIFHNPSYFLAILQDYESGSTRKVHVFRQMVDRLFLMVDADYLDLVIGNRC